MLFQLSYDGMVAVVRFELTLSRPSTVFLCLLGYRS